MVLKFMSQCILYPIPKLLHVKYSGIIFIPGGQFLWWAKFVLICWDVILLVESFE